MQRSNASCVAHRRPTTTRSCPARSSRISTEEKPAPATSEATASASPTSSASSRTPVDHRQQAADRIHSVGAPEQRQPRLVQLDLGRQRGALGHVGQVRQHRVERPRNSLEQVGLDELHVEPERGRVRPRHRERVGAQVDTDHRQIGSLLLQGERDSAAPGPDVRDPGAPIERQRDLDQQLGLGPRDQHPAVDRQRDPPERLAPDDVRDRLARLAPGQHRREPLRGAGIKVREGVDHEPLAPDPEHERHAAARRRAGACRSRPR